MTTTYAAHIITGEGDPEIAVMTDVDEAGESDFLVSYPIDRDEALYAETLEENGWRTVGETTLVSYGAIVNVRPDDLDRILRAVTHARAHADAEYQRQDVAWRTIIRDAMQDGESATKIADAAKVSRERVYQIRDGRR